MKEAERSIVSYVDKKKVQKVEMIKEQDKCTNRLSDDDHSEGEPLARFGSCKHLRSKIIEQRSEIRDHLDH
uniref:Uncharacterized protein n=1 Tax=Pristionchus pacificus TaxID=54126 RepID=A0A2A6CY10_PRIPA|eukprot:PDM83018.1 hypothetical protein PRIPAC_37411 [Pristionchus pacificus]